MDGSSNPWKSSLELLRSMNIRQLYRHVSCSRGDCRLSTYRRLANRYEPFRRNRQDGAHSHPRAEGLHHASDRKLFLALVRPCAAFPVEHTALLCLPHASLGLCIPAKACWQVVPIDYRWCGQILFPLVRNVVTWRARSFRGGYPSQVVETLGIDRSSDGLEFYPDWQHVCSTGRVALCPRRRPPLSWPQKSQSGKEIRNGSG